MSGHARPALQVAQIFSGLNPTAVNAVFSAARKEHMPARKLIVSSGEPSTRLFMIDRGRVRYYKTMESGDELVLDILTAGDVFGLGTLLTNPPPYFASAQTLSECDLLFWKDLQVQELAAAHPEFVANAFRIVLQRLKQFVERHARLLSHSAEQRVAATLVQVAHHMGRLRADGVEIDATNEQLGELADVSSFTTSRVLNQFARSGTVSKQRGKVVIHAPEALLMK